MLLFKQARVSPKRWMPVDLTNVAKKRLTRSAEIIQLYYFNSEVYTIDGGEAAGTIVVGKTSYAPLLWTLSGSVASYWDSSFYFTSDALTTEVGLEDVAFEAADYRTPFEAAKELTKNLTNGQYVVDYRRGIIYGKKATTWSTLTAASYHVCAITTFEFANADWNSPSSSPSTSPSSSASSSVSSSASSSVSSSPSTSVSSSPSSSPSTSVSSSPSSSVSPSTSLSSSPSTSKSSSVSSSPSTSKSSSPSSSESSSISSSVSPSSSPSSSNSSSPSSSISNSTSASVSPSASPSLP